MKNQLKAGIAVFILAALITFIGAILKIQQSPAGGVLLVTGLVLQLPAVILVVIGLVKPGISGRQS